MSLFKHRIILTMKIKILKYEREGKFIWTLFKMDKTQTFCSSVNFRSSVFHRELRHPGSCLLNRKTAPPDRDSIMIWQKIKRIKNRNRTSRKTCCRRGTFCFHSKVPLNLTLIMQFSLQTMISQNLFEIFGIF